MNSEEISASESKSGFPSTSSLCVTKAKLTPSTVEMHNRRGSIGFMIDICYRHRILSALQSSLSLLASIQNSFGRLKASISNTLFRWISTLSPLSGRRSSDFLAWNRSSAPTEILLGVVEAMTFYSADMSFPPTPFLLDTQPVTAATVESQLGIKCHLGGFQRKVFKVSAAVTSVTFCARCFWV